jgi:hypothetical protein
MSSVFIGVTVICSIIFFYNNMKLSEKAVLFSALIREVYYIAIFVLICILPQKTFGVLNANLEKLSEAEVFQSCTD